MKKWEPRKIPRNVKFATLQEKLQKKRITKTERSESAYNKKWERNETWKILSCKSYIHYFYGNSKPRARGWRTERRERIRSSTGMLKSRKETSVERYSNAYIASGSACLFNHSNGIHTIQLKWHFRHRHGKVHTLHGSQLHKHSHSDAGSSQ